MNNEFNPTKIALTTTQASLLTNFGNIQLSNNTHKVNGVSAKRSNGSCHQPLEVNAIVEPRSQTMLRTPAGVNLDDQNRIRSERIRLW